MHLQAWNHWSPESSEPTEVVSPSCLQILNRSWILTWLPLWFSYIAFIWWSITLAFHCLSLLHQWLTAKAIWFYFFKLLFPQDHSKVRNIGLTSVFPGTCILLQFPAREHVDSDTAMACQRLSVSHLPPVTGVSLTATQRACLLRPFLVPTVLGGVSPETVGDL